MPQDVLSSALELFETRAVYAGGLLAGGDWAIRFLPPKDIKFFVVGKGNCMLAIDGQVPRMLEQGDVFLMREQASFVLASNLTVRAVEASDLFAGRGTDTVELGTADEVLFLGSHLSIESAGTMALLDALPPSIHIKPAQTGTSRLEWLIREYVAEAGSSVPGASSAMASLAQLIFLQILRSHISLSDATNVGWLRAIFDARIGPALARMHEDPAHAWDLVELAASVGMSRTAFATHFKSVAGVPPLTYLTEWRMRIAESRLRGSRALVGDVARSVGYSSEAAFSTAFKRVTGKSPRQAGHPKQHIKRDGASVLMKRPLQTRNASPNSEEQ